MYTAHKKKRSSLLEARNAKLPEMSFLDKKKIRHTVFFMEDRVIYQASYMKQELQLMTSYNVHYFLEDACKVSLVLLNGDRHFYISLCRENGPIAQWITKDRYEDLVAKNAVSYRMDRLKNFMGNAINTLKLA